MSAAWLPMSDEERLEIEIACLQRLRHERDVAQQRVAIQRRRVEWLKKRKESR